MTNKVIEEEMFIVGSLLEWVEFTFSSLIFVLLMHFDTVDLKSFRDVLCVTRL